MEYTNEQRSKVGKLTAALRIELVNLLQEGLTGSARAIESYLASASFESRLRLHKLITEA